MSAFTDALPRWTRHVVTEGGGRDPLGLSRLSFAIADRLMPAIVVNTDRARYYSLYAWVLWHVAREDRPETETEFARGFQRRDSAIAYSMLLQNPDTSCVGKLTARKRLQSASRTIPTEVRILPSNPLGGYGQYYQGSIWNLGLTHRLEQGFDQVTDGLATDLAQTVHACVAKSPYVRDRWFEKADVPVKVLKDSADFLGLDAIRGASARDERDVLTRLFFDLREESGVQPHSFRRLSLTRILQVLREYERAEIGVEIQSLDDQLLYAPAYHGVLINSDGRARPYAPPVHLAPCSHQWRQFCLHEYLTQSLELLLMAVLEFLGETPGGATPMDVAEGLVSQDFREVFKSTVGSAPQSPKALLGKLGIASVPDDPSCIAASKRFARSSDVHEDALLEIELSGPAGLAGASVMMLSLLYAKWRGSTDTSFQQTRAAAGPELAAATFLPTLDRWLHSNVTWHDAVSGLLTAVLHHHDRVMYEKGRLESCWVHLDGDRLVRDQDYQPTFRSPRHRQAVTILCDLLLLRDDGEHLSLTKEGRRLLEHIEAAG